jgi:hypothetical protein
VLFMKKLFLAALLASTVVAGASAAYADTFTLVLPPPAADGSISANYGRGGINGSFSDTWNFTLPSGFTAATISSIMTVNTNNVTFSTVTLNGTPFTIDSTGSFELRHLPASFNSGGPQTLAVSGVVDGGRGEGAYAGVVSFTPGTVPEPATWALMILGVGLAGGALRASRRRTPQPSLA